MKTTVRPAKFLLPDTDRVFPDGSKIDLTKWSVIACDQHTSDISYWERLKEFTGAAYSALNLILPEAYLSGDPARNAEFAEKAGGFMRTYLDLKLFREYGGMVFVERAVSNGGIRKGILLAVDLEDYSFVSGAKTLIRASEGTVLERLPPRVAVREQCPLELPHIMLLYEDPDFKVLSAAQKSAGEELYNFELNFGGGHIKGTHIPDTDSVTEAFNDLIRGSFIRHGEEILFAVGDGNHSLAAAKVVYENAKKSGNGESCRYALCEAVNLYDPTLVFEPIHRLIFTDNPDLVLNEINKNLPLNPIEAVAFTDKFASDRGLIADYVHGEEHLKKLAGGLRAAAVKLKPMDKADFFPYVIKNGSLPKKTFSMGEAEDKRYYLEAAKII